MLFACAECLAEVCGLRRWAYGQRQGHRMRMRMPMRMRMQIRGAARILVEKMRAVIFAKSIKRMDARIWARNPRIL